MGHNEWRSQYFYNNCFSFRSLELIFSPKDAPSNSLQIIIKYTSVGGPEKKLNKDYSTYQNYPTFKAKEFPGCCLYIFFNHQVRLFSKRSIPTDAAWKALQVTLKTLFHLCTFCVQNGQNSMRPVLALQKRSYLGILKIAFFSCLIFLLSNMFY